MSVCTGQLLLLNWPMVTPWTHRPGRHAASGDGGRSREAAEGHHRHGSFSAPCSRQDPSRGWIQLLSPSFPSSKGPVSPHCVRSYLLPRPQCAQPEKPLLGRGTQGRQRLRGAQERESRQEDS